MRKLMVLMMAFAVVVSYSVLPMNQAFAASKRPAKVKNLKVAALNDSETSIQLKWKKVKKAKKYQVYRATKKKGKFKKVATVKTNSYVNKGLKDGKKYYYKVRAVNGKKKGKFSAKKSAKAKYVAPAPAPVVSERTVFVDASYVKNVLDHKSEHPNLVIAEVSWGPDAPKNMIPGSIHVNTDDLESNGQDYNYEYWDLRGFNDTVKYKTLMDALATKYGITKDTELICYGWSETDSAVTRLAMASLMLGVKDVKVLDGGATKYWPDEYGVAAASNPVPAASFGLDAPAHSDWIISTEEMLQKTNNPNFKLVSIRSYDEFIGKNSGYAYIDKAGEPAGAIWGHDTDDGSYFIDGKTVGIDKLNEYLAPYGASTENELAFYCGTGWRATIPFLICYEAGIDNMKLWDDGWYVYSGACADGWNWVPEKSGQKDTDGKPMYVYDGPSASSFNDYPVQIGDPAKGNVEFKTVGELEPVYNPLRGDLKAKAETVELAPGASSEYGFTFGNAAKDGVIANSLTYTSSNPNVATVDGNGIVTVAAGASEGSEAIITATGKATFGSTPTKEGTHKTASYKVVVKASTQN